VVFAAVRHASGFKRLTADATTRWIALRAAAAFCERLKRDRSHTDNE